MTNESYSFTKTYKFNKQYYSFITIENAFAITLFLIYLERVVTWKMLFKVHFVCPEVEIGLVNFKFMMIIILRILDTGSTWKIKVLYLFKNGFSCELIKKYI